MLNQTEEQTKYRFAKVGKTEGPTLDQPKKEGKTYEILAKKAGIYNEQIYGYSRFGRSVSRRNYKRNRDGLKSGVVLDGSRRRKIPTLQIWSFRQQTEKHPK
jgi:hypothetical protein